MSDRFGKLIELKDFLYVQVFTFNSRFYFSDLKFSSGNILILIYLFYKI